MALPWSRNNACGSNPLSGPGISMPYRPTPRPWSMTWNAPSTTDKPMDDTPRKNEPPTILVVDDKADSRQLLMRMLRVATRAVVMEARDGEQALIEFMVHQPCLTFLDIDMPGTDGLAALGAIRAISPDASIVM